MDWPVCLIGLGLSPGRNDETPPPIGSICFKPVHVYLARSNPSSTALHPYLGHQLQRIRAGTLKVYTSPMTNAT